MQLRTHERKDTTVIENSVNFLTQKTHHLQTFKDKKDFVSAEQGLPFP